MFPFLKALAALSGILHSKVHMPLQNSVCSCSFKVFLIQALHARARVEEGGLLRGRTRDAHSKLSNIRLHTNRKRCSLSTQAQSFASQILITCSHHTLHTSHHTRARAHDTHSLYLAESPILVSSILMYTLFAPQALIRKPKLWAKKDHIICSSSSTYCTTMYVCMHACMHACMYVRTYVCMQVCMYVCMYVRLYVVLFEL